MYLFCGCSSFIQEFRNWESAWALEALFVVVYEIRVLAERVILLVFTTCIVGYFRLIIRCAGF